MDNYSYGSICDNEIIYNNIDDFNSKWTWISELDFISDSSTKSNVVNFSCIYNTTAVVNDTFSIQFYTEADATEGVNYIYRDDTSGGCEPESEPEPEPESEPCPEPELWPENCKLKQQEQNYSHIILTLTTNNELNVDATNFDGYQSIKVNYIKLNNNCNTSVDWNNANIHDITDYFDLTALSNNEARGWKKVENTYSTYTCRLNFNSTGTKPPLPNNIQSKQLAFQLPVRDLCCGDVIYLKDPSINDNAARLLLSTPFGSLKINTICPSKPIITKIKTIVDANKQTEPDEIFQKTNYLHIISNITTAS